MTEPGTQTTRTRRSWLAAAVAIVAIGLAGVALSDLRRAPVEPAASTSSAPLAGAPQAALPSPHDDAPALENARRKEMRNPEPRGEGQQPTPLTNAWSDAFKGKPSPSIAPAANGARDEAPPIAPRLRGFAERVKLTPEQLDTLAHALDGERTQIATLRQQRQAGTLTHAQARAQIDTLRERTDAQVAHVLDREQLAAFSEMRDHGKREDGR